MMQDRIVFVTGEIETNMAQLICAQLLYLESIKADQPITMFINSPGGVINAGLAIVDTMAFIKPAVHTYVMGMAASMGSYIASQGEPGHRYALPNAEILIHQPLGGLNGSTQATDFENAAKHIVKLKRLLTQGYVDRCNNKKTYDDYSNVMERDFILDPNEAIEWGLIDYIVSKRV
jgi:ATP-dependent Clp protease protease subunit